MYLLLILINIADSINIICRIAAANPDFLAHSFNLNNPMLFMNKIMPQIIKKPLKMASNQNGSFIKGHLEIDRQRFPSPSAINTLVKIFAAFFLPLAILDS